MTPGGDPLLEQTFSMRDMLDLPYLVPRKAESKVLGNLIFNWKSKPGHKNIRMHFSANTPLKKPINLVHFRIHTKYNTLKEINCYIFL